MNEWPLSQFAVRSSTLHKDAREIEVAESKGVSAGRFFFLEYSPLAGSADRSESADPARIVRGRNAAGVVHLKTQVFSIAELVDKESDFELAVVDAFASTGNAIQLPPRVLFGSLFDDKSPSFAVDLPEESAFDAIQVCRDSATGLIRCLVWSKLEDRKSGGEPLTVSKGVNGPVGRYLQQELICASLELPVVLSQRIFWENGDLSLSRQLQSSPPFSGSLTVDKWLLSRPSIVSIEMLQSKKSDSQEPSVRTLKRFDVSVGVHSNA